MATAPRKNLILIGYRGSGKTVVGRRLAQRLQFAFVDTDAMIAAEAGTTIADIFATEGESGFRRREAEAIRRIVAQGGQVIGAGGGAILRDDNVDRLRQCGIVVWLTAPPNVLWSRIERDEGSAASRPALSSKTGLDEVRTILSAREPRYREASHARVDASVDDVDRVAEAVLAVYESLVSSSTAD